MLLIGEGRIGTALYAAGNARGVPTALVSRDSGWQALDGPQGDPVVLCVRNDDLDEVLARIPDHRREDLVLVQNGAIRDYLSHKGLSRATRGLLYFAVTERHGAIQPGRTSWFTGPHAAEMAATLTQLGATSQAIGWPRFTGFEFEKMLWLVLMGPLCEAHDSDVGTIADAHADQVVALCRELAPVARASMAVELPAEWLAEQICDYSRSIPDYRASVKEWAWRNGWMVRTAYAFAVPTPLHHALLRQTGHMEASDVTES